MKMNVFASLLYDPREIVNRLRAGDEDAIHAVHFSNLDDLAGWTKIGQAEIGFLWLDEELAIRAAVQALQAKLESERAESQRRQNALIDQINRLTAIEHKPTERVPNVGDEE